MNPKFILRIGNRTIQCYSIFHAIEHLRTRHWMATYPSISEIQAILERDGLYRFDVKGDVAVISVDQ